MVMRKLGALQVSLLIVLLLLSCSSSFDSESGVYSHREKGFSSTFPSGWTKAKVQPGALVTVTDPDETSQINIVVQELPEDVSLDKYFKTVTSQGGRMGARITDRGEMTIDGKDALWSNAGITVGGSSFSFLNYYVMNKNRVYTIVCTSADKDFPAVEETFDTAVESFRFIDG